MNDAESEASVDLSSYSGDVPMCPACFRTEATRDDRRAGVRVRDPEKVLCWRRVIPGPSPTAECAALVVDLAAIERKHPGALMGCVLLNDASPERRVAAGLAALTHTPENECAFEVDETTRTPTGDRVLAALRAKLEGLSAVALSTFSGSYKTPGGTDTLLGRGLVERAADGFLRRTPIGSAALALHDDSSKVGGT